MSGTDARESPPVAQQTRSRDWRGLWTKIPHLDDTDGGGNQWQNACVYARHG